jgi:hypothetical protein
MKSFSQFLSEQYSNDDAKKIGDSLLVDWTKVDIEEFTMGLNVESEHDDGSELDVVDSTKDLGKIVLAHLKELPNYYSKLKQVEEDSTPTSPTTTAIPTNSVGAGNIAGLRGDPVIRKIPSILKRKKTQN